MEAHGCIPPVLEGGALVVYDVHQPVRLDFEEDGAVEDHLVDFTEENFEISVEDTLGVVFDKFIEETRETNETKVEAIR